MSLLVFTDLDGSLMDHDTYSIEAARPSVDELIRREFPLVLNSSKTRQEILSIQDALQLNSAFVCENGAALQLPGTAAHATKSVVFGPRRTEWLAAVHSLRSQLGVKFAGFADWTIQEIAALTGLSASQAERASAREYSEPILWHDTTRAKTEFTQQLATLGLQLLEGGRFFSIQGKFDKSDAIRHLIAHQKYSSNRIISVGLGDSPNDIAMLECVDVAVVIKSGNSDLVASRPSPRDPAHD